VGCYVAQPKLNLTIVEEIELLTLESFSVQIFVIASGYLPNSFTEIGQIIWEREKNTFLLP